MCYNTTIGLKRFASITQKRSQKVPKLIVETGDGTRIEYEYEETESTEQMLEARCQNCKKIIKYKLSEVKNGHLYCPHCGKHTKI